MKKMRLAPLLLVLLVAVACRDLDAQARRRGRRNEHRLPEVGAPLPDVVVFDEHGNEFSTRRLRGHYSVLVFGCLT